MKVTALDYKEFLSIAIPIIEHLDYQKLKAFLQHGKTNVYDHSLNVALRSFIYGKKHELDYRSMTKGALLHDFFLYDWHDPHKGFRWHGYKHPHISYKNAQKIFGVNELEIDIIVNHMFPLTLFRVPKSKESWIVCLIDKKCSLMETLKINMKVEII